MKNKLIAYIPVVMEYETFTQKKQLLRDLADKEFLQSSGTHSFQKKRCRIKDIKITNIPKNGKKEKTNRSR